MVRVFAIAILGFVLIFQNANGHTYSLGTCPVVEPQSDFEMSKMLGVWYVMQKTSTGSSCITYNFTKTDEPYTYELEQVSQHFALGLTPLSHEYHYTGKLTVPDEAVPARMSVRFPLSVAGSASYTVFMTDYVQYAGIFTCQKLGFAHRDSATILSRQRTLEKMVIDKLRNRLSTFNVDPFSLSIISQKNCPRTNDSSVNINIDDDTFSAQSVAGVIRKAGEKIGDGVEYVAGGAKKIYHKYSDTEDTTDRSGRLENKNADAEWIP